MGLVLDILNDVRQQIAAKDEVLTEARERRNLVTSKSMSLSGTLRQYSSGSVAHGTANDPVEDADAGIVLDRRSYPKLGPDGDGEGPEKVIELLREIVGPKVRDKYPDARVGTSKRGLLVRFGSPVQGQDPSVDLIVTLMRKEGDGLWIPNLASNKWDASHPEKHTELFTDGTRGLRMLRALVTRLAKAWNKQWSVPALCSFNLQALAWESVTDGTQSLEQALAEFFAYAAGEIKKGNTKDPAGLSKPIRLLVERKTAVRRLSGAADALEHSLEHEDDEEAVRDALAKVYRDYIEPPSSSKSAWAAALRKGNEGISVSTAGLMLGGEEQIKTTRSFGG